MKDSLTLDLFEQEPHTGNMPTPAKMIEEPAPDPAKPRPSDWNPDQPLGQCIESEALRTDGYGQKRHAGKRWKAHRLAWMQANGDIPPGLQVRHICGNRACVNIDHLRLGTARQNREDALVHGTAKGGIIQNVREVYNRLIFRMTHKAIAHATGVTDTAISEFARSRGLSRDARKLTPAQREEAARRFSAGERADHLAQEFSITVAGIHKLARTRGLHKPIRRKWRASINLAGSLFE